MSPDFLEVVKILENFHTYDILEVTLQDDVDENNTMSGIRRLEIVFYDKERENQSYGKVETKLPETLH